MQVLTICIPVFNCEETICECIDSVLKYYANENVQILIIDNASTDNTYNIVKSYDNKKIYSRRNFKNLGFAENFKKCIKFSQGEYITFLGGDDVLINNNLIKTIDWIKINPSVFMSGSDLRVFVETSNNPTRNCVFGNKETIYNAGDTALIEWWLASTLSSIGGWIVSSIAAKKYVNLIPNHTIIPQFFLGFYIAKEFDVSYYPTLYFAQRLSNNNQQLANQQYLSLSSFLDLNTLISLINNYSVRQKLSIQLCKMVCENLLSFCAIGGFSLFLKALKFSITLDVKTVLCIKYLIFVFFCLLLPDIVIKKLLLFYRKNM